MTNGDWASVAVYGVFLVGATIWVGFKTARFIQRISMGYDEFWRGLSRLFAGNDQRQ